MSLHDEKRNLLGSCVREQLEDNKMKFTKRASADMISAKKPGRNSPPAAWTTGSAAGKTAMVSAPNGGRAGQDSGRRMKFARVLALLLIAVMLLFGLPACSGQDGSAAADLPSGTQAAGAQDAAGDPSANAADNSPGSAGGGDSETDGQGQSAGDSLAPLLNGEKNGGGTASVTLSDTDAAAAANQEDSDVIEVREKMFVGQMNDMFLNPDDYVGKTIRYEGFYDYFENESSGERYDYVLRNGPGCCGYDSLVGLEISWSGAFPEKDDWCRVQGVLEAYQEGGGTYLVLNLESLDVLPVRGNDTVTQ
jgi:hypothetical protein